MLRKISRSISRGRERAPSPEFVSADARQAESRAQSREGNRASHHRTHGSLSFESQNEAESAVVPIYLDTTLEALSLEPIVGRTLTRMRPTIAHGDILLPPAPRRKSEPQHACAFPLPPPRAHQAPPGRLDRDAVILRSPPPAIVVTPPTRGRSRSPDQERNPFEESYERAAAMARLEPGEAEDPPIEVTPLPTRPLMRRNAASYRTQRELPLRVQAVRRAHQEEFAVRLSQRSPILPVTRRASEAARPPGPPPSGPLPERPSMPPRSRSVDSASSRGRSMSPKTRRAPRFDGSLSPGAPLPRVREEGPEEPVVPDWYLQAAMADWSFDG